MNKLTGNIDRNGFLHKGHRIEAVIFDMDGTLIDSEPVYFEADKKLLDEYGVPDYTEDKKQKYVGISSREMMIDMKKIYNIAEDLETLIKKKDLYYFELAGKKTVPFPEMVKFLKNLRKEGYLTALATGSSWEVIDLVMEITGLKDCFNIIVSAEEVKHGKPSPDIFLEAARRLGVEKENCLVVEDSQYGVEAAKAASMPCIAIPDVGSGDMNPSYYNADLLFEDGMSEFTASKAMGWLNAYNGKV